MNGHPTHLGNAVGPPSPYLKASMSVEPQTLQELDLGERVRSRGKILKTSFARGAQFSPEIKVSMIYIMPNVRHYKTIAFR